MQLLSAFPYLEELAFGNRFLIMGYIHLIMIGFISFFIFAIFYQLAFLKIKPLLVKTGVIALIAGFLGSEIILLGLGFSISFLGNLFALFILSTLMAIGVLLILIGEITPLSND